MNRRNFFKTIIIGTAAVALPIPRLSFLIPKPTGILWSAELEADCIVDVNSTLRDLAIASSKSVSNSELMFASLIAGIKRQTIFMGRHSDIFKLDVGAAHVSFAEQIDKSVDDLTMQDRQQAVLNAVLEEDEFHPFMEIV